MNVKRQSGKNSTTRTQAGLAVIEFSLVVPVMFLILGGLFGFGCFLFETRLLSEAAYVGTSAASKLKPGRDAQMVSDAVSASISRFLREAALNPDDFVWRIESALNVNDVRIPGTVKVTLGRRTPTRYAFMWWMTIKNRCSTSTSLLASEVRPDGSTRTNDIVPMIVPSAMTGIPGCA